MSKGNPFEGGTEVDVAEKEAITPDVSKIEKKIADLEELKKRILEDYNITDDNLSDEVKKIFTKIDKKIGDSKEEIEILKSK